MRRRINYGGSREPVFTEVTERGVLLTRKAMKLVTELKQHRLVNTEPAILVLDQELQEIYRLPTVWCNN